MELFGDELYAVSGWNYLRRHDLKTGNWEKPDVPWQQTPLICAASEKLFAVNDDAIFEILDKGHAIRILASCRRRPTVSALDSLDKLAYPSLFAGPNRTLYAGVMNRVFSWNGSDWHESADIKVSGPPEVFSDAVIFRPSAALNGANLWIWQTNQAGPELYLREKSKSHSGNPDNQYGRPGNGRLRSLTVKIKDDLANSAATFYKSNLYFLSEQGVVTNLSGHWTIEEKAGCHARLICLDRDHPEPIVLPLKFDLRQGLPPFKSLAEKQPYGFFPGLAGPSWLLFAGDHLYFGQRETPGIWAIHHFRRDNRH